MGGKLVHAIRRHTALGQKHPERSNRDIKVFFHNARYSYMYSYLVNIALIVLDAIASSCFLWGHSPYNLDMLARVDELWQSTPLRRNRSNNQVSQDSDVDGPRCVRSRSLSHDSHTSCKNE